MKRVLDFDIVRFALRPNPKLLSRLAQYPDDPTRAPYVRAAIVRGSFDDELFLVGRYIRPNLGLELFTVEHSPLCADGTVDPTFRHYGRAWYHAVLEATEGGVLSANVAAVLLDQVYGLDVRVRPAPTGTFHIGLWFKDAARLAGDDVDADARMSPRDALVGGPLAMISVPVAATGTGPLCTHTSPLEPLATGLR
jgi:hypothetical protein